jgi:hypothetical protein
MAAYPKLTGFESRGRISWRRLLRRDVASWHIASFRCDAEFGRYRGKTEIGQATWVLNCFGQQIFMLA